MENKNNKSNNVGNEQKKLWQGQMQTLHEALMDNTIKMNRNRMGSVSEIHQIEDHARQALKVEEKILDTAKEEYQDAQRLFDAKQRAYREECQRIRQRKEKQIAEAKNRRCMENQRIDNERSEIFRLFGVDAKQLYDYGRDNPEQR